MLNFLKLDIEGFCSISKVEIPLNQNCTILIKAPNGFGKSSLFSALVWALYGKNLKGKPDVTTWKELQPKDYKGVKVEVFFQKDSKLYKIIRCQGYQGVLEDGAKGKDRLLIYEDSELLNVKGKVQLQDSIVKSIGFSYNLFINSIMFGQGLKRLVQESKADKKKIFEEVFDLGFINEAKNLAQDKRNIIQQEYREKQSKLNSLNNELSSLEDTYKDLLSKEKEEKKELLEIKEKLKTKQKSLEKELSLLTFSQEKFNKVKEKLSLAKEVRSEAKSTLNGTSLTELVNELYDLISTNKVAKALELVKSLRVAMMTLDKVDSKIEKLQEKLTELQGIKYEYTSITGKLSDIKDDLETVKKELSKLKKGNSKNMSAKYSVKIKKYKDNIKKLTSSLELTRTALDNYDWVIQDPLGNQGIKAYLFDSSLTMVNQALEKYTELLGFKIEFSIDLDSTRKDFVTLIERDNHIIDYEELSGGEKQIVNIAMAFAMNEVLTASRGINLAFLDEVFESLSQDNIEVVISLIKFLFEDKTLFLITHHESLPLSNTKILQVEKIKGLSSYKVL